MLINEYFEYACQAVGVVDPKPVKLTFEMLVKTIRQAKCLKAEYESLRNIEHDAEALLSIANEIELREKSIEQFKLGKNPEMPWCRENKS